MEEKPQEIDVKDKNSHGDQKESQLYSSIRSMFEDSGTFQSLKCQLRAKILEDIRKGKGFTSSKSLNVQSSSSRSNPSCPLQITCTLIDEFFDWMGFQYTREMLSTESGMEISSGLFKLKVAELYQNFEVDDKLPTLVNIMSNIIGDVESMTATSSDGKK